MGALFIKDQRLHNSYRIKSLSQPFISTPYDTAEASRCPSRKRHHERRMNRRPDLVHGLLNWLLFVKYYLRSESAKTPREFSDRLKLLVQRLAVICYYTVIYGYYGRLFDLFNRWLNAADFGEIQYIWYISCLQS